jgi:hypothetical protein
MGHSRRPWFALAALFSVALGSCDLPPDRTGSCQPATPLALGTFERGEAYHDDCTGPEEKGDFFTLSLAVQTNMEITIVPEGSFAPTFALYKGTPGDADPALVARVAAGIEEPLAVRLFLQAGSYFVVAGTGIRTRAPYRILADAIVGADCAIWNFVSAGIELDGNVTLADCETSSEIAYAESFEMWRQPNDSITMTVVADSGGYFQLREACCEFKVAFFQQLVPGDSVTFGHRSPNRRRPYRATYQRDVVTAGPGTYRLRIH